MTAPRHAPEPACGPWLAARAVWLTLGVLFCLWLVLVGWSSLRVWQADRHSAGNALWQADRLQLQSPDGGQRLVLTDPGPLLDELARREPWASGRVAPDCRLEFYRQQQRLDAWFLAWEPATAHFHVRPAWWGVTAQDYRRSLPAVAGGSRFRSRQLQARLVSALGGTDGFNAFFRACRR